jgi:hypothetical protein
VGLGIYNAVNNDQPVPALRPAAPAVPVQGATPKWVKPALIIAAVLAVGVALWGALKKKK